MTQYSRPLFQHLYSLQLVRWGLVLILSLFVSHYLSYGKLPLSVDYEFPLQSFLIVVIHGVILCYTNTFIYSRLDQLVTFQQSIAKRLANQFLLVWISTILIFSLLQIIFNLLILNREITFYGFTYYLSICLFISTFETIGYTSWIFYNIFKDSPEKLLDNRICIKMNGQLKKFKFDEIAYIHSKGGIVTLVDQDKKRYITQFSALSEVENDLPKDHFFRINRQFIINKEIIKEVVDKSNRTLLLSLKSNQINGISHFTVSRYKSREFKKWFVEA